MNKTALIFLLAVSGTAFAQEVPDSHEHDPTSTGAVGKTREPAPAGAEKRQPSDPHAGMDMKAMCDMHRQMMSAPAADRAAMMDKKMKGMPAEQRRQHMKKMEEQCK